MTVELDMRQTNLHPMDEVGLLYRIPLSFNEIKIGVPNAAIVQGTLLSATGEFISCDTTFTRNGVLKFSLHKADIVGGTLISRIPMLGRLQVKIKKTVHRREEARIIKVDVIPG